MIELTYTTHGADVAVSTLGTLMFYAKHAEMLERNCKKQDLQFEMSSLFNKINTKY